MSKINQYNMKTRKSKKGGKLYNKLFCHPTKRPKLSVKEYNVENSPAMEYYLSQDRAFEVTPETLPLLKQFQKSKHKYFKFLIFQLHKIPHIYVIYGNVKFNKHPTCYLQGIKDYIHRGTQSFGLLMEAIQMVDKAKDAGILLTEQHEAIVELNGQIFANLKCMEVEAAGSGTMIDDVICINNKSGHFNASFTDIEPYAREMFEQKTGLTVTTQKAPSKQAILHFLNKNGLDESLVNRVNGLCLQEYET
jgi:hypothetical protein